MEDSDREEDRVFSGEEDELHSAADTDNESGSEEDTAAGALLDLEASESGEEGDDDDDDDGEEYGWMSAKSHDTYHRSFPQFCRLPIELRQRVWEFFDPDLRAPARIFDVLCVEDCLWPSGTLEQQTAPARTLLEVHRESRYMGLKFYPDTLPLNGSQKSALRYNRDRDIIFLGWMSPSMDWGSATWANLARELDGVRNLAFETKPDIDLLNSLFSELPFRTFASLQTIYPCWDAWEIPSRSLRWCVSDKVHTFYVETEEQQPGLGEDMEMLYCWPDLENHPDYAEEQIPKKLRLGRTGAGDNEDDFELWPIVLFSAHQGVQRYHRLREKALAGPDANWDSDSSAGSNSGSDSDSSEENEYESEGIDDATIDGDNDSDDSGGGNDLVVRGSSADDSDDDEDGSHFAGLSPQRDVVDLTGDAGTGAQFSSLEPESPRAEGSDDDDAGSDDEPPVRKVERSRRRVVVASDSEDDDSAEEAPLPKPKTQKSPPQQQTSRRGAKRVVLSDSDDDDSGEGGDLAGPSASVNKKSGPPVKGSVDTSEDDSEEEEDSDDDDDDNEESSDEKPAKKPLSLAERLRLYRSENPVSPEGSASEDSDHGAGIDEDDLVQGGVYGDYDDDDDGGGDDLGSENDLIDMTEDVSDGGGGGGDDDDDRW